MFPKNSPLCEVFCKTNQMFFILEKLESLINKEYFLKLTQSSLANLRGGKHAGGNWSFCLSLVEY